MQLTQKERGLLQDQLKHEEVCIRKYNDYAAQASDPQLQQMFNTLASHEEQHYDTVNQLLQGQVPSSSLQSSQQSSGQSAQQSSGQAGQKSSQGSYPGLTMQMSQSMPSFQSTANGMSSGAASGDASNDAQLCQDMLMTEKYVSGTYDTAIFEFADENARHALNHIQGEEQQHGKDLYDYLQKHGMYKSQ